MKLPHLPDAQCLWGGKLSPETPLSEPRIQVRRFTPQLRGLEREATLPCWALAHPPCAYMYLVFTRPPHKAKGAPSLRVPVSGRVAPASSGFPPPAPPGSPPTGSSSAVTP